MGAFLIIPTSKKKKKRSSVSTWSNHTDFWGCCQKCIGSPDGPGMLIFNVTKYKTRVPRPHITTTTPRALAEVVREARNFTGAIIHNKATHMVRVKKIDTAVLMANIWPNLAKNWITVKHRGIDPTTVVVAELRMAVPIWETAARVLQPRISLGELRFCGIEFPAIM